MKKAISLVLTLALAMSLLAGCSSSTSSTDSSSNSSSSTTTSSSSSSSSSETTTTDAAEESVDPYAEPVGIVAGSSATFYSPMDGVTQLMPGQEPQNQFIYPLMYDTLFYAPGGEYDELEGLLAKDWTVSDDGCIWVINLQEDVYYHNGTNMTADLVIRCFQLLKDINNSAPLCAMDSFEATGEYQITFTYTNPAPELMYQFAGVHTGIFDPTLVEELGVCAEAFDMAGTGPYYLSDSAPGDYMTFTAYEGYWNEERMAHIETLNCKVILDTNTQVTALMSGEMDYGAVTDYDGYETLLTNTNVTTEQFYGTTWTIYFNVDRETEVFSNIRVREAISMMVDMDEAALASSGGYGFALDNAYGGGIDYVHNRVYDPEGGLAILAEEGVDPSSIVIEAITDAANSALYTNIQSQLAQYGITVDFVVQDTPAVTTAGWNGEWDLEATSGGINRYSFASPMTTLLGETGIHNVCRDAELDPLLWDLIDKAFGTVSRDEEMEYLAEIAQLMDEHYAYLGAVQKPTWVAYSNRIQNYVMDQYNGVWHAWEAWVVD